MAIIATGKFTDLRDGKAYRTVLMPDGRWWSRDNLAFSGYGYAYASPADGLKYGRLYTYSEGMSACPPGCHIPAQSEWDAMLAAIGDPRYAGKNLKSTSGWIVNSGLDAYGFSAMPGGYEYGGSEGSVGTSGFFNSSTFSGYLWVQYSMSAYIDTVSRGDAYDPVRMSVRFIVDSGNVPDGAMLFGADFDGFDRGTSVTIDRNIVVVDTLGGPPRLIERGPSSGALDRWTVSTTFAVPYDKAQAIQAAVPPYGTDTTAEINLPPRSGGSSFPGLGPASSGATFDTYAGVAVRSLESKGQMGVRVDLYGFGIEFDLFCTTTGGGAINSAAAPTVTVPAFVARKFRAHQLNDFSKTQYAVSGGGVLAANSAKIKAGRRKDLNVALDHLTPDEADQLVALFRGVRTGAVTLPFDSDGRPGSGSFLLTGLSFQRQALFWDAKLEVSAA